MKKIFAMVLLLLCFNVTAFALAGEGTEESPFIITNEKELMLVSKFPDSCFQLANDIELEGPILPLCYYYCDDSDEVNGSWFKGVFDGNGHTISNFSLSNEKVTEKNGLEAYVQGGLFYSNMGIIKNLTVKTPDKGWELPSKKPGILVYGAICKTNKGRIEHCRVEGSIYLSPQVTLFITGMGGLCHTNTADGVISHCTVDLKFNGYWESDSARWFVGAVTLTNNGIIEYTSTVFSGKQIIGITAGGCGKISNCYSIGDYDFIAGGRIRNDGYTSGYELKITNSYFVSPTGGGIYTNGDDRSFDSKDHSALKNQTSFTNAGFDFDNIWTIDDRINDGFPCLLWEKENLDYEPSKILTQTQASVFEENLVFDITIDQKALGRVVHLALYDENNRLLRTYKVPNLSDKKNIIVALDNIPEASYVKIFVWDSITSIAPLGDCERRVIVK